jgi:hypothetical protein
MRVAYGKMCRVVEIDPQKWGQSGGDNEAPALLLTLATRHPDVEWLVSARNSGWEPPLPNVVNPWREWNVELRANAKRLYRVDDQSVECLNWTVGFYDELTNRTLVNVDQHVLWMGQHGTSNSPLPSKKDRSVYTKPQISAVHYGGYVIRAVNCWRYPDPLAREEVWLLADARNHIKCRDPMWPRRHPVLTQFNFERGENLERYGDPRDPVDCGFDPREVSWAWPGVWRTRDRYVASGLEIVGVPTEYGEAVPAPWEERDHDFGMLINEARGYGLRPELTRLDAMKRYVNPIGPSWTYGTWSSRALAELGYAINPIPYPEIFPLMQRTKTTFTTPSSGSHWATAKPWESFATGVVCFFHPLYDTQDHILFPDGVDAATDELRHLHTWLRVKNPEDLERKIKAVTSSRTTWEWLVDVQWRHFRTELERQRCVTMIEKRLGLCSPSKQSSSPVD